MKIVLRLLVIAGTLSGLQGCVSVDRTVEPATTTTRQTTTTVERPPTAVQTTTTRTY